jgi:hypothetical protein
VVWCNLGRINADAQAGQTLELLEDKPHLAKQLTRSVAAQLQLKGLPHVMMDLMLTT